MIGPVELVVSVAVPEGTLICGPFPIQVEPGEAWPDAVLRAVREGRIVVIKNLRPDADPAPSS
jgi:hypothetical protein